MKTFTTFAAVAALVSTAFGASVKIEETPCLNTQTELKSFDVEIGTLKVGSKIFLLSPAFSSHTYITSSARVCLRPQDRLRRRRRSRLGLVPGL
jgi:hypothetical protein